jgi:hypothetical protein
VGELGRAIRNVESAGALRALPQITKAETGECKMALRDEVTDEVRLRAHNVQNDLRRAPYETIPERIDYILTQRGWDRKLNQEKDKDFSAAFLRGLEYMAMLPGARDPLEAEKERLRRARERAIEEKWHGDFFKKSDVSMPESELAGHLHDEKYWVESLQQFVMRADLPGQLKVLHELFKWAECEREKGERTVEYFTAECSIFAELHRRASAAATASGVRTEPADA